MKKILIDGHNLIPKVGGISLSDPEDEAKLTARVSEYCRLAKVKAELFFDGAPPGKNATSRLGLINVHHVRQGTTADAAIIQYLHREGHNARNLLVVSSDHEVQNKARMLHSEVMSSDEFARQMRAVFSSPQASMNIKETPPSEEEVEEMLKLMTENREENSTTT